MALTLNNEGDDMPYDFETFSLDKLRERWADVWGCEPHCRMGPVMMIKSLKFKAWEDEFRAINPEYQERLVTLIKTYKRDPRCFDDVCKALKPGTRLERISMRKMRRKLK